MQQEIIITISIIVILSFHSVLQSLYNIFILIASFHNVPRIDFGEDEIGENCAHAMHYFFTYGCLSQHSRRPPLCLPQTSLYFILSLALPQFLKIFPLPSGKILLSKILDILKLFSQYSFPFLLQRQTETWTLLTLKTSPISACFDSLIPLGLQSMDDCG